MAEDSAPLDAADRAILRILQGEGRLSNAELASRVHLSESACLRRLRSLEARGVITGYAALVEPGAVGRRLSIFLTVTLVSQAEHVLSAFERAAGEVEDIMECWLLTGEADYLMRVVAADIAAFERLHATRLTRLPGVARITSRMVLRSAVRRQGLPI